MAEPAVARGVARLSIVQEQLHLADAHTRDDLRVFLERLLRSGQPEVRLVTRGDALAVFGCTQSPASLMDPVPVVLVMRAFQLRSAPSEPVDSTVAARALLDRIARMSEEDLTLLLPDTLLTATWAGVLPPLSGWQAVGVLEAASLSEAAEHGISRVAQLLPEQPGEAVVRKVRAEVWGAEIAPGVPAAAAFAAESMGFLKKEDHVLLAQTLTWTRLTTARGQVIVRALLG